MENSESIAEWAELFMNKPTLFLVRQTLMFADSPVEWTFESNQNP
jgi:hypothetical protein